MDVDPYESIPKAGVLTHMTAGAIAGIMEHCIMYPLDSVKTRMQSLTTSAAKDGISGTFLRMVRHEGMLRPVRGMSAMVFGAGPSHAIYFSSYEFLKKVMCKKVDEKFHTIVYGSAGCISTILHDFIMNPAEVVKQRMQMSGSPYKSVLDCAVKTYKTEGAKAFYRSYTTQVIMNVPYQSIHFIIYELAQNITNKEKTYNPTAHMVSGALAGAVAAAITTPLDVCKTLLNTQQGTKTHGFLHAVRTVYRLGGPTGFFRGVQARVMFQMPATAICWSTYEFFKYMLGTDGVWVVPVMAEAEGVAPPLPDDYSALASEDVTPPTPAAPKSDIQEIVSLKLPAMSGAGIYGSISYNTMHTAGSEHGYRKGGVDVTRTGGWW